MIYTTAKKVFKIKPDPKLKIEINLMLSFVKAATITL